MNVINYRKDICQKFIDVENQIDFDSFHLFNIRLWPILRYLLGNKYSENFTQKLKKTIKADKNNYSLNYDNFEKIFSNQDISINNQKKEIDHLFLVRDERYRFKTDAGYYINQLDDLYFLLNNKYQNIRLQEITNKSFTYSKVHKTYLFSSLWQGDLPLAKSTQVVELPKKKLNFIKDKIQGVNSFFDKSNHIGFDDFIGYVNSIIAYYIYADKILKSLKPKVVFSEIQNPYSFGFNLAAKKNGIVSAEVQHGNIGVYHYNYTHQKNESKKNINLFPDYLICFDEMTKLNILGSNKNNCYFPISLNYIPSIKTWKPAEEQINKKKINILIAYGYESMINNKIVEVINRCKEINFFIRLHPEIKSEAKNLEKKFFDEGIKNVQVQYPTNKKIYDLLLETDCVVTSFSTVAQEAAELNIENILVIGEFAKSLYEREISSGKFQYRDENIDEIYNYLKHIKEKKSSIKFNKSKDVKNDAFLNKLYENKINKNEKNIEFFSLNINMKDYYYNYVNNVYLSNHSSNIAINLSNFKRLINLSNFKRIIRAIILYDKYFLEKVYSNISNVVSNIIYTSDDKRYSNFSYPKKGTNKLEIKFHKSIYLRWNKFLINLDELDHNLININNICLNISSALIKKKFFFNSEFNKYEIIFLTNEKSRYFMKNFINIFYTLNCKSLQIHNIRKDQLNLFNINEYEKIKIKKDFDQKYFIMDKNFFSKTNIFNFARNEEYFQKFIKKNKLHNKNILFHFGDQKQNNQLEKFLNNGYLSYFIKEEFNCIIYTDNKIIINHFKNSEVKLIQANFLSNDVNLLNLFINKVDANIVIGKSAHFLSYLVQSNSFYFLKDSDYQNFIKENDEENYRVRTLNFENIKSILNEI